ncbi:MAG: calcium:proton antiporter [Verrucomicrobiota bacterium]|nr:calcium:proton antiporter [Verrucomicrobiota bacterium]
MSASPSAAFTPPGRQGLVGFIRSEYPLFAGLATAAIFYTTGSLLTTSLANPFLLSAIFFWLFGAVLWSAISVVRHADYLAIKCGEPYGTLILTLAAITIEVMMISAAMLHGANNPTLARDMMFAVLMIALNGLIGLSLLLGGLRHREQSYNLKGTNAYLSAIMALSVLGLVLPDFTTSMSGPNLSRVQEIFLATSSLILYGIFVLIQTMRHSQFFVESGETAGASHAEHAPVEMRSGVYHSVLLVSYLVAVILLAEKFAIPLDVSIERFGMPHALGGAIVAALVLAPEALSALQAALGNRLQRAVNILHGSVLASIGLTIPAVLAIGLITNRQISLGLEGGNLPLLILTLGVSVVTFAGGKTSIFQGCIHLLLFGVFLLLIFSP